MRKNNIPEIINNNNKNIREFEIMRKEICRIAKTNRIDRKL